MDNAFGAPTGSVADPSPSSLKNEFNSIPNRSLESMIQSDRIQPRQVGTGTMRGTQRINNTDGSYITMGVVPGTTDEFGFAFYTPDGTLVRKSLALTDYFYNVDTGKNIIQSGQLPDGSYGTAVAKTGYNVSDGITA